MPINRRLHILVAVIFLLVAGVTYSNSLHSPLIGDDHAFFSQQPYSIRYILHQILPDLDRVFGVVGQKPNAHYRPLTEGICMLSHLAFGKNVFSFHMLNLILFSLTAFCIYVFLYILFKDPWLGFLTGLLYCVHPINGQIVNYITASVFPVQIMLMLGTLYFISVGAVINRPNVNRPNDPRGDNHHKRAINNRPYVVCFLFLLSLWCHESAMVLPFYAVLILVLTQGMGVRNALKKSLPLWVLLFVYFLFRLKYASLNVSIFNSIGYFNMSFSQYLATFTKLICWYLSNLILPIGIVFSWVTPVVRQGAIYWVLIFCGVFTAFIFVLYYYRHKKIALLALLWLAMGFVPLTFGCLIDPTQGFIIEPQWLFFSCIGFFLFLAWMIGQIPHMYFRIAVTAVLLISWSLTSRWYNYLWSDEERYDLFWLQQSPDYQLPKSYLARVYFAKNDLKRARYYYQACFANRYMDYEFYSNLGLIDYLEGNIKSAKINFAKALSIEPRLDTALTNLGTIATHEGRFSLAKDYFEKSMRANPFGKPQRFHMARILEKDGHVEGAIKIYLSILEFAPHEETALISLLKVYWERKDYKQVVVIARELAKYSGRSITQNNVGIIFRSLGLQDEARKAFERAKVY